MLFAYGFRAIICVTLALVGQRSDELMASPAVDQALPFLTRALLPTDYDTFFKRVTAIMSVVTDAVMDGYERDFQWSQTAQLRRHCDNRRALARERESSRVACIIGVKPSILKTKKQQQKPKPSSSSSSSTTLVGSPIAEAFGANPLFEPKLLPMIWEFAEI